MDEVISDSGFFTDSNGHIHRSQVVIGPRPVSPVNDLCGKAVLRIKLKSGVQAVRAHLMHIPLRQDLQIHWRAPHYEFGVTFLDIRVGGN